MLWSLALDPHWALPRWEIQHVHRPRCIYDLSWLNLIWMLKYCLLFSQLPSSTIWTMKTRCWRSNRLLFGACNGFQPFWKTTELTTLLWCYIKKALGKFVSDCLPVLYCMKCLSPFQRSLAESFLKRWRLSSRGQDQNKADVPFFCFVIARKYLRSVIQTSGSPCCSFVLYTMQKKLRQIEQTL